MKVIDGNFGAQENPPAAEALDAFKQIAEEGSGEARVAIVLVDEYGVSVGGNLMSTPDIIYMLQVGLHTIMNSVLEGGSDETTH